MPRHIQTFHLFSDIGHQYCSQLEKDIRAGQGNEVLQHSSVFVFQSPHTHVLMLLFYALHALMVLYYVWHFTSLTRQKSWHLFYCIFIFCMKNTNNLSWGHLIRLTLCWCIHSILPIVSSASQHQLIVILLVSQFLQLLSSPFSGIISCCRNTSVGFHWASHRVRYKST